MKKQQKMMAVIALLVFANIVRWYYSTPAEENPVDNKALTPAAFFVQATNTEVADIGPMQRDLFQITAHEDKAFTLKSKSAKSVDTVKAAMLAEQETAQSEISKIKLLGVVIRNGKAQAYLAYGAETFLVFDKDTVANRFYVEKVAVDSAEVLDQKLNIRRTIPMSGR